MIQKLVRLRVCCRTIPGDWRNTRRIIYQPMAYADAAVAMNEVFNRTGLR